MNDKKGQELTPEQLEKIAGGKNVNDIKPSSSSSYKAAKPSSSSWKPVSSSSYTAVQ